MHTNVALSAGDQQAGSILFQVRSRQVQIGVAAGGCEAHFRDKWLCFQLESYRGRVSRAWSFTIRLEGERKTKMANREYLAKTLNTYFMLQLPRPVRTTQHIWNPNL